MNLFLIDAGERLLFSKVIAQYSKVHLRSLHSVISLYYNVFQFSRVTVKYYSALEHSLCDITVETRASLKVVSSPPLVPPCTMSRGVFCSRHMCVCLPYSALTFLPYSTFCFRPRGGRLLLCSCRMIMKE